MRRGGGCVLTATQRSYQTRAQPGDTRAAATAAAAAAAAAAARSS